MAYAIGLTRLSVGIFVFSFYTSQIESRLSLTVKTCGDITDRAQFHFVLMDHMGRRNIKFGEHGLLTYNKTNKGILIPADSEGSMCTDISCQLVFFAKSNVYNDYAAKYILYESFTIREGKYLYVSKFNTCEKRNLIIQRQIAMLCSDPNLKAVSQINSVVPMCVPKTCRRGKYGDRCEKSCTRCQNGQCKRDGECVVKVCKNVLQTGIKCDETCVKGRWGLEWKTTNNVSIQLNVCHLRCFCRYGAQCNAVKGTCPKGGQCEAGYKIGCQEKCPPRTWSSDNVNCDNRCECNVDEDCYHDGICPNGPKKSCQDVARHYGPNCTKQCHCINREKCNVTTGHCTHGCDLLHYGKDCQYVCIAGRYQMKNEPEGLCSGRCYCKNNQSCNATNGNCAKGCAVNYWGEACERECKYGPDCVNGRLCHCLGGQHECNNETGCSVCSHRWLGQNCQTTCKDNFWGPPGCENPCHCAQPSDCRVADGECRGPCPHRKYGNRCNKDCKNDKTNNILCQKQCNCLDDDVDCDPISRTCRGRCDIRYSGGYGRKCERKCTDGHYTDKSMTCSGTCRCLIKNLCNVTDGACVGDGGCLVGWVEPTCLEECIFGGHGCQKSCRCFKNSTCHPITGTCPNGLCERRYYGTDCQRKCPDGKFIETGVCKGICHCANPGQCRASDGECMDGVCSTGWEGDSCQTQCSYGLAIHKCRHICHCKGGHLCDRVTGYCPEGCDTRYHGRGCTLRCPRNHFLDADASSCTKDCHCLNPHKCNATDGECIAGGCESGYQGSDCQTKCRQGNGKFGKNCEENCHCISHYDCNIKTGRCSACHLRYIGYNCQRTCPAATYLINGKCEGQCHCNNISNCHLLTGECSDKNCAPGWLSGKLSGQSDGMCNIPCPNGTWGQRCIAKCHCREGTPCNHTNGYCEVDCDTRWYYRPACNETCRNPNKYLDKFGKCTLNCECVYSRYCRVEHGVCIKGGCKSGGQAGSRCLEPCENRRYRLAPDKNCTGTCHCIRDELCHDIGGFCLSGCHHRYRGLRCNATCVHGTFGDKCSDVCRCANVTSCHVDDGKCSTDGCEDGYQGPSCQKPCSKNTYGPGCKLRCQCLNNAKCNHTSGECPNRKCNKRYDGQNCDNEICPAHRYRIDGACDGECHCLKSRDCDAKTGSCGGSSCVPGRSGESCQHVCRMSFGYDCKKRCHCFQNRQCDIVTGYCPAGCDIRHTGKGCQEKCPAGRYDPFTGCNKKCRCDNSDDCHIIDGYCRGGLCQASRDFRFFGIDCQSRCKAGRYVSNGTCSGECRCMVPEQCSVLNGSCNGGQCKPGWLGDKCNRECEDGRFGPRCSKKCRCKFKKPCEKDYGKCENGCDGGWTGENCQWRKDYGVILAQIGTYAGSIAGLSLLASIFGYCAVLLRRRRRKQAVLELKEYLAISGATSLCLNSDRPFTFEVHSPEIVMPSCRNSRVSITGIESSTEIRQLSRTGRKINDGDSVQHTHTDNFSELNTEMHNETQREQNIEALSRIDLKNDFETMSMRSMRIIRDVDKSISDDVRGSQHINRSTAESRRGSKSRLMSKTSLDIKASKKSTPTRDNPLETNTKSRTRQDGKETKKSKTSIISKTSHHGKDSKKSKTSQNGKKIKKSKTSQGVKEIKKSKSSQDGKESKKSKTSQDGKKIKKSKTSQGGNESRKSKTSQDGKESMRSKTSQDGKESMRSTTSQNSGASMRHYILDKTVKKQEHQ